METDGLPFAEAVERLASMAGLPLPAVTPDAARHEQRRRTLHDVMELGAKFFAETLASRVGAKARGYLADRALSPSTQLQFRLGYASHERFALKEHLGKLGVSVEDMIETGLLVAGNDIPVPYDRFRDRVMFPITDLRGRVIAFGGRALEKDVPAKYLNSPETPLFHKGDNLYNHQTARAASHNGAPVVVVEGYVDVIAMVTAGFAGSVAPLGTALTENQLALLWKMADEPILCFDGDKAGQKAAYRAADLALPFLAPGKSLRFALLPEGQDPDDLARSGGRGAIEEVIAAARPLADMIWSRELEGGNFATPRAPRRAGGAHQGIVQRHPRRGGSALLSPGSRRAASAYLCPRGRARRLCRSRQFPLQPWGPPIPAARWRTSESIRWPGIWWRPSRAARSDPTPFWPLSGGQRPAGGKSDHEGTAQRYLSPRGPDPANPDQPSLAAA